MRNILLLMLSICLVCSLTACAGSNIVIDPEAAADINVALGELSDRLESISAETASSESGQEKPVLQIDAEKRSEITEGVLEHFTEISKIPRPSGSEKKISDFMKNWAKEKKFEVIQDSSNNILITVPAAAGYEKVPVIALQGHMDMVAVAEEGYAFDPEKDPVRLINDGTKLTADHTSLGADNGIGIAIMMYLLEHFPDHGKIKLILTTDEEETGSGARNVDPAFLSDVQYLINVDQENSTSIVNSSASNNNFEASKKVKGVKPTKDNPVEIRIEGGLGGHSGLDIEKNHVNAIKALCDVLAELDRQAIPYEIAEFTGGTAYNAIPDSAKAVLMTDSEDYSKIEDAVNQYMKRLNKTYHIVDPDLNSFIGVPNLLVEKVLPKQEKAILLSYCLNAFSGIYSYSFKTLNFVSASANLGFVEATPDSILLASSIRSSEAVQEEHLLNMYDSLAAQSGYSVSCIKSASAWPINADGDLIDIALEAYYDLTFQIPEILPLHAGLECGEFHEKNPDMQIISIGADLLQTHSPEETLILDSVPLTEQLLEKIIQNISERKDNGEK